MFLLIANVNKTPKPIILPPRKGDIDGNGRIDKNDMDALLKGLVLGDMNDDKVIDNKDIQLLMEMLGYREGKIPLNDTSTKGGKPDIELPPIPRFQKGDMNQDGQLDSKDFQLLFKIFKAGDMNNDGKVDYGNDVRLLNEIINKTGPIPLPLDKLNDPLLTEIKTLTNDIIKVANGKDVNFDANALLQQLFRALAKYTGKPLSLQGNVKAVKYFFIGIAATAGTTIPKDVPPPIDSNGDGKLDYLDVIKLYTES